MRCTESKRAARLCLDAHITSELLIWCPRIALIESLKTTKQASWNRFGKQQGIGEIRQTEQNSVTYKWFHRDVPSIDLLRSEHDSVDKRRESHWNTENPSRLNHIESGDSQEYSDVKTIEHWWRRHECQRSESEHLWFASIQSINRDSIIVNCVWITVNRV